VIGNGGFGNYEFGKAKGRSLFRDFAPFFPIFRRPGSDSRSQLIVISELFGTCERSPPFPVLSLHHIRCKSFLVPSRSSQFPECFWSPVSGSLASSFAGSSKSFVLVPLRVPFPIVLMVLVYSLLLEDFSSVELKDTRNFPESNGC
jgi:hypothetical protein